MTNNRRTVSMPESWRGPVDDFLDFKRAGALSTAELLATRSRAMVGFAAKQCDKLLRGEFCLKLVVIGTFEREYALLTCKGVVNHLLRLGIGQRFGCLFAVLFVSFILVVVSFWFQQFGSRFNGKLAAHAAQGVLVFGIKRNEPCLRIVVQFEFVGHAGSHFGAHLGAVAVLFVLLLCCGSGAHAQCQGYEQGNH